MRQGYFGGLALYTGIGLLMMSVAALGQQRSFVSCPIVRDTKTVPCFLAEDDGEVYYLGIVLSQKSWRTGTMFKNLHKEQ